MDEWREWRAVIDTLNAWADEDLARVRALHAALTAQVLPRMPPVIAPTKRHAPGGSRRRLTQAPRMER